MELHYIIHTGNIVELIINNNISNGYYIEALEDVLRANSILDPRVTLSFSIDSNRPMESSILIHINYAYFNKTLIPILERKGFIVMPHINNKIFAYYIQYDETTIQIFFNNHQKRLNEFIILDKFLKYTLETIKNNTFKGIEDKIFTVKASLDKYSIIIKSKYLFKELPNSILAGLPNATRSDSIITFLKLNGFCIIEYTDYDIKPQQYRHNRLTPR